ncbi:hypothetical protein [Jiella sonneratiae]|uniref:Uncharacterized protein n=1 Tax=Jiella sonneratiae TaxID=2816856 RepID=A0ABS3JAU4_9HYPH|nr:hypothetical protein [Jiella sonneratiae]MBO0906280.1 hypothetical protein [Jiella sonneratiae]
MRLPRWFLVSAGATVALWFSAPVFAEVDLQTQIDALRTDLDRLKTEVEALKDGKSPSSGNTAAAPAIANPAPAAPPLEPGCMLQGSVKYCTGWTVSVFNVDPRGGAAALVGRFVPENAARIGIEDHKAIFAANSNDLEYRGEGFFNARETGAYSFLLDLTPGYRDKCRASLSFAGTDLVSADDRRPNGSATSTLQPGLYPIGFRLACSIYPYKRQNRSDPSTVLLRVLTPKSGAPRPLRAADSPADSDVIREAP